MKKNPKKLREYRAKQYGTARQKKTSGMNKRASQQKADRPICLATRILLGFPKTHIDYFHLRIKEA
jgi:hypothetical protein